MEQIKYKTALKYVKKCSQFLVALIIYALQINITQAVDMQTKLAGNTTNIASTISKNTSVSIQEAIMGESTEKNSTQDNPSTVNSITNSDPVFSPEERKIEIIINLSSGLKYSPSNFRNLAVYKKSYNYSGRSLDEKKILIEYWNLINTRGTLAEKKRIKSLVANIGIGLKDSPEAFESKDVFNRYYGYREKTPQLQSVLDKFWRMVGSR